MKAFTFILIFISVFEIKAQRPTQSTSAFGKITGKIIDSTSIEPIEYATISLLKQESKKVVNGTTADTKGTFKLSDIPDGKYKILISFIGYKTKEFNNIIIDKTHYTISLGTISLVESRTDIKEVVVTANKLIEEKIDKTVYNVDKDVSSQTGAAADVLKKVPQVSVDVDGNVELQGNSNVKFLIDGKPSVIFGSNVAEVLQSIPANQIKNIEIITSQGAKDDASGTGGIINIILKKSTAEGYNGNISLTGGTRLENGSLNLNGHHGHFSVNAFVNGNAQLPSTTTSEMNKTTLDTSTKKNTYFHQDGSSLYNRKAGQSGLGFNWDISPKDNLTGSFGFNYMGYDNEGKNYRKTVKDSTFNDIAGTTSNSHNESFEWGLNYRKNFAKEDQKLEFSYLQSYANNYSFYQETKQYTASDSIYAGSNGKNPGTQKETQITIDYAQPLGKLAIIELGGKAILSDINSTSNVHTYNKAQNSYFFDQTLSNAFNYKSTIYAGYLSTTFKLLNWLDVKTGVRYENTKPEAYFSNSGNVTLKSYGTFVPSAIISHKFEKSQMVKLSYTRRIERPAYKDLNPFVNASDSKDLTMGNPNLKPEIGNKIELSYSKSFEKGSNINATFFYRGNKDDIQAYKRAYSKFVVGDTSYTDVSVTTRENVGRENNYGINLFVSVPIKSKLSLRTNIAYFQRYIINGTLDGKNVQGYNYRINGNATYSVNSTLVIELSGNFNSPRINVQGKMPSFTTYNFALRKQFFKKKASLAFTATNFFSRNVEQKTIQTGSNFTSINIREIPYRSFGINFSYKFGKLEFKKEREKESEDNNQLNPGVGN